MHAGGPGLADDFSISILDDHSRLEARDGKRLGFHFQAIRLDDLALENIFLLYFNRRPIWFNHARRNILDLHSFGKRNIELAVFFTAAIGENLDAHIVLH